MRLAVLSALVMLAACGDDAMEAPDGGTLDDGEESRVAGEPVSTGEADLVSLIEEDGRFTVLHDALVRTGLAEDLRGGGYTLFAPTDDAFARLGAEGQAALLDPANRGALRTLLRYHAVSGEKGSEALRAGEPLRSLTGRPLTIDETAGRLTVGGAVVTEGDRRASDGVIHVIDAVLLPPDDLL